MAHGVQNSRAILQSVRMVLSMLVGSVAGGIISWPDYGSLPNDELPNRGSTVAVFSFPDPPPAPSPLQLKIQKRASSRRVTWPITRIAPPVNLEPTATSCRRATRRSLGADESGMPMSAGWTATICRAAETASRDFENYSVADLATSMTEVNAESASVCRVKRFWQRRGLSGRFRRLAR